MRIIRLAVPVYVELLAAVVAVGLIDAFWLARLGAAAVAAVTVGTTVEYLAYGVMLTVTMGTTVVIARRTGRGEGGTAEVRRTAWMLWAAVSLLIAVPGFLLREPLAALFVADPTARRLTADFLAVSLPLVPIYFAQATVDAVFKGHADTRTPMRMALLSNGLVFALDPLLIHGLDLGVPGAALATAAARAITLAIALTLLRRRHPVSGGAFSPGVARDIAATGTPGAGDFLSRNVVAMILINVIAGFGVAAVAGYGVANRILLAGAMFFYAVRQAAMIESARSPKPVEGLALRLGLGAGLTAAVILAVGATPLMRLFTTDPQVVAHGADFLRAVPGYLILFGGLIALSGVLQGTGRGGRYLTTLLIGYAAQIPLAYALSAWLGLAGVWAAMTVTAALQLALTLPTAFRRAPAPVPVPAPARSSAPSPATR
ncbi:MATE family efflux transporter [Bailinhaonella thermotolerans]|uniref:Probable multidrug resistance protein NorM n=1 Tax=Bailinhaonella thermotolerans TaxID=1070861 RepID=A0A3A4AEB5_9ACTN|nr:MATE family efflux transporter [Bailinhaonella thermotolerans]RJL25064.1 MATE family efflux transporter [Bailinhaonella thermotolerans]